MHGAADSSATERHVALLRGVNVGGKNKLPMADLARLFVQAGCSAVRTYIQSGNVVFTAKPAVAADLPATIEAAIAKRFGLRVPVVLRSAAELDRIVTSNPLLAEGFAEESLHVAFLKDRPSAASGKRLDPQRSPEDRFVLRGSDLFLALPGGVPGSKLTTAYLDATLGTTCTARNWRTVRKLAAMASGAE